MTHRDISTGPVAVVQNSYAPPRARTGKKQWKVSALSAHKHVSQ
jgi:hypothetical protein